MACVRDGGLAQDRDQDLAKELIECSACLVNYTCADPWEPEVPEEEVMGLRMHDLVLAAEPATTPANGLLGTVTASVPHFVTFCLFIDSLIRVPEVSSGGMHGHPIQWEYNMCESRNSSCCNENPNLG